MYASVVFSQRNSYAMSNRFTLRLLQTSHPTSFPSIKNKQPFHQLHNSNKDQHPTGPTTVVLHDLLADLPVAGMTTITPMTEEIMERDVLLDGEEVETTLVVDGITMKVMALTTGEKSVVRVEDRLLLLLLVAIVEDGMIQMTLGEMSTAVLRLSHMCMISLLLTTEDEGVGITTDEEMVAVDTIDALEDVTRSEEGEINNVVKAVGAEAKDAAGVEGAEEDPTGTQLNQE